MSLDQLLNQSAVSHADLASAWEQQLSNNSAAAAFCGEQVADKQKFFAWFRMLPLAQQEQLIYGSLAATTGELPGELDYESEMEFLKKFLFRYKMMPLSDEVFSHIGPDDFIEVYNPQGIQIYRSWNFFKFCRYTIDEVLSNHWIDLYERPEFVERKILDLMPSFFSKSSAMIPFNIAEHVVTEKKLNPSYKYANKLKFVCPLQDMHTKEIVAAMSVAFAKRIDN